MNLQTTRGHTSESRGRSPRCAAFTDKSDPGGALWLSTLELMGLVVSVPGWYPEPRGLAVNSHAYSIPFINSYMPRRSNSFVYGLGIRIAINYQQLQRAGGKKDPRSRETCRPRQTQR